MHMHQSNNLHVFYIHKIDNFSILVLGLFKRRPFNLCRNLIFNFHSRATLIRFRGVSQLFILFVNNVGKSSHRLEVGDPLFALVGIVFYRQTCGVGLTQKVVVFDHLRVVMVQLSAKAL